MARRPRLHLPGALHHVILRGNARQDIFFTDDDRREFLWLVADGVARFGHRIHAYCLMTNHVHLAVQQGERPLCGAMQNLSFRYTRHLNHRLDRVGHVFQGRYKAFLVEADRYALGLVRYIHLNPVRATMVRVAQDHPWSSHRGYLGRSKAGWLTTAWVLGMLHAAPDRAREAFAAFVDGEDPGQNPDDFRRGADDPRILGDTSFMSALSACTADRRPPPSLEAVFAVVGAATGLTPATIRLSRFDRRATRAVAMASWLASRTGAARFTELAAHLGRDPSTLSRAASDFERLAREDETRAAILGKIEAGSGLQDARSGRDGQVDR